MLYDRLCFPEEKALCIKRSESQLRLLSSALLAFGLSNCSEERAKEAAAASGAAAPVNEVDGLINEYEKVANEFVRVTRKHRDGDASVTMRVIELKHLIRESAAKVQQESPKMTPPQAQRVAGISSKTSPYLQP